MLIQEGLGSHMGEQGCLLVRTGCCMLSALTRGSRSERYLGTSREQMAREDSWPRQLLVQGGDGSFSEPVAEFRACCCHSSCRERLRAELVGLETLSVSHRS